MKKRTVGLLQGFGALCLKTARTNYPRPLRAQAVVGQTAPRHPIEVGVAQIVKRIGLGAVPTALRIRCGKDKPISHGRLGSITLHRATSCRRHGSLSKSELCETAGLGGPLFRCQHQFFLTPHLRILGRRGSFDVGSGGRPWRAGRSINRIMAPRKPLKARISMAPSWAAEPRDGMSCKSAIVRAKIRLIEPRAGHLRPPSSTS